MKGNILIYADIKEKTSGIIDILIDKGVQVIQKSMEIGDYLLSDRVCVERKTVSDFVGSIKN